MKETYSLASSLRDNHQRGTVGEYLAEHVSKDSNLAFVSACFTINAFGLSEIEYNQMSLNDLTEMRVL